MRLRRAVLQTPPKSSVPPRLPFYKIRPLRTRSESTLAQLLIPLHFNSARINTYIKPGGGSPPFSRKVLQLVTTPTSPYRSLSTVSPPSATPFLATLASHRQLAENKTTLSPAVATLTDRVKHKSFACHSYKNTRGGGLSRLHVAPRSRPDSSFFFHTPEVRCALLTSCPQAQCSRAFASPFLRPVHPTGTDKI